MNNEDFVTYEQAKILKELGFDWECTHGYYMFNDKEPLLNTCGYAKNTIGVDFFYYSAPTLAQAQKWLRLVKNIIVNVIIDDDSNDPWSYEILSNVRNEDGDWVYLIPQWKTNFWSETPEQALSAGIDKALELLAQKTILEDFQTNKLNYDVDKGWFIKNQHDSTVDEATKLSKKRLLIRLLRSLHNIEKY